MSAPLVSAIVPVYNAERFLAEALDSALAQTLQALEIIVVDDGSTDASGAIADRYAAAHPQKIRVIHQQNGGLVAARNAAIAMAHGRYLALLDADDVWLPHHLVAAVGVLEHDDEVGLVHANVDYIDAEGCLRAEATRRFWHPDDEAFMAVLLRHKNVSCPTAVFRRALIDEVGVFDPVFNRLGCEDRDLWLRIAKVSGLHYLDSVHARYRWHGTNMSSNLDKMMRARLLLVERHTTTGDDPSLRSRAIAAVHAGIGDERFYDAGQRMSAIVAYGRALIRRPFMKKAWRGIARCLLKPSVITNSERHPG